jgi:hypothetical protein
MWVNCKIISSNPLLYTKFKEFIIQTPFLVLLHENTENGADQQIIFWDVDTRNIESSYVKEIVGFGSIIIVISSLLSKDVITKLFEKEHLPFVGTLTKHIIYSQFVDEISRIMDAKAEVRSPIS